MNVVDLRTFEAVVRHGSMSSAAVELCTVQSNISARIRAMEEELGRPLFYRNPKGVTATPAAERIRPLIARITVLIAEIHASVRDIDRPCGALTIGAPEATTALRLAPLLTAFSTRWKDVRMVVKPGTSLELLDGVVDRRLDGAIVAGQVEHEAIVREPLFSEELVLVSSPSLRSLEELKKQSATKSIMFGEGCPYQTTIDKLLEKFGINPDRIRFGSLESVIACASAGIGVALLPHSSVASAVRRRMIAAHRLPDDLAVIETSLIYRRDGYKCSTLGAFMDLARSTYSKTSTY